MDLHSKAIFQSLAFSINNNHILLAQPANTRVTLDLSLTPTLMGKSNATGRLLTTFQHTATLVCSVPPFKKNFFLFVYVVQLI